MWDADLFSITSLSCTQVHRAYLERASSDEHADLRRPGMRVSHCATWGGEGVAKVLGTRDPSEHGVAWEGMSHRPALERDPALATNLAVRTEIVAPDVMPRVLEYIVSNGTALSHARSGDRPRRASIRGTAAGLGRAAPAVCKWATVPWSTIPLHSRE